MKETSTINNITYSKCPWTLVEYYISVQRCCKPMKLHITLKNSQLNMNQSFHTFFVISVKKIDWSKEW